MSAADARTASGPIIITHVPLNETLRGLLGERRIEELGGMAARRRRILGSLVSLTFDPDPLIGWRAVEAMGAACRRIAETDPDAVRQHLRRLHWLITEESGGICWRSPEAMAEIVSALPELFADYIPIIVHLLVELAEEDLEHFRAGTLWAIGRLGSVARDHVAAVLVPIESALADPDPQVRGMAAWCLGQMGRGERLAGRSRLLADDGPVDLYEDGMLSRTSVRRLARRALGDKPTMD